MQVTLCKEPFEFILIDDTYTEEELRLIFAELDFWTLSGNLKEPKDTGAALENNKILKKNKGLFLDEVYSDRSYSNILKLNRKIFSIKLDKPSLIVNILKEANADSTLVSYYEDSDFYKSHRDGDAVTAVTYLYKQPKAFDGGDLVFPEYGYAFEPWFNRTYIFPGPINHSVDPVVMKQEDCGKGLGRYCISNFIHVLPRNA